MASIMEARRVMGASNIHSSGLSVRPIKPRHRSLPTQAEAFQLIESGATLQAKETNASKLQVNSVVGKKKK